VGISERPRPTAVAKPEETLSRTEFTERIENFFEHDGGRHPGGIISSTVLNMLVLPAFFLRFGHVLRGTVSEGREAGSGVLDDARDQRNFGLA
jgi:hypothetical protein